MRTLQVMRGDLSVFPTVHTVYFDGKCLRFNAGSFCDRALCEHVEIDLDTVRDDPAELSDTQPYDPDPGCVLRLCLPNAVVEYMFCYAQLMRDVSSCKRFTIWTDFICALYGYMYNCPLLILAHF